MAEQDRDADEETAEQIDPVAERVESRERDVARTDLKRNDEVEEGGTERHDRKEDHGSAVHREYLVVRLGAHQMAVGTTELRADDLRFETTNQKEEEGGEEIECTDLLVIGGGEPTPDRARFVCYRSRCRRRNERLEVSRSRVDDSRCHLSSRLLECLEVCHEVSNLLIGQSRRSCCLRLRIVLTLAERRHQDAGLHGACVLDPTREMRLVVDVHAGCDGNARPDVREIGPDHSNGERIASNGMTCVARAGTDEELLAGRGIAREPVVELDRIGQRSVRDCVVRNLRARKNVRRKLRWCCRWRGWCRRRRWCSRCTRCCGCCGCCGSGRSWRRAEESRCLLSRDPARELVRVDGHYTEVHLAV